MVEVIDCSTQANQWDDIVQTFPEKDVYYTSAYARLSMLASKSCAYLFYTVHNGFRMCIPLMVSDVGSSEHFMGKLKLKTYYDAETPYGYSGPLYDGNCNRLDAQFAFSEFREALHQKGIVSVFIRFHPLLKNHEKYQDLYDETRYMHHTIYIDTESKDTILKNLDTKNRNMIRKARKNDISILMDFNFKSVDSFQRLYTETMNKHQADEKYYFSDRYYSYMKQFLGEHVFIANAIFNEKVIASAIFFLFNSYLHYHLSGSKYEYRNLAPSNLLLYEIANWACDNNIRLFHLGGGMEENDSLFEFKKKFNKRGYADFWIGKIIADREGYDYLLQLREKESPDFDRDNSFMIQYRR